MAEAASISGKSGAQLDAQIERIRNNYHTAVARAEYGTPEFRRQQDRWFNATRTYGRLRGDDRLIDNFKDYRPSNRFFTSADDIRKVENALKLNERNTASLNALRNNVVAYYERETRDDRDKRWDMMPWMQSITAVIDQQIRRKGGNV